jgi:hypothetical protein
VTLPEAKKHYPQQLPAAQRKLAERADAGKRAPIAADAGREPQRQ